MIETLSLLFIGLCGLVVAVKLFMFIVATGTTALLLMVPVAFILAVLGLFKKMFSHKNKGGFKYE